MGMNRDFSKTLRTQMVLRYSCRDREGNLNIIMITIYDDIIVIAMIVVVIMIDIIMILITSRNSNSNTVG